MMKKIWGILIVGLLVCNISYGKTIEGLFGLKLGELIDQSIIINEVKEIPNEHIYIHGFYIGQDELAYQIEPPEKNKIFTHYFVKVYPISKKIYKIYAFVDSWTNPETLPGNSKLKNRQYFKALEKYLAEKYESIWQNNYLDSHGFIYMVFNRNILKLSSPDQRKLNFDVLFGAGPGIPTEFGISLTVLKIDESEFLKLIKDKEEKKIKEEEELYDKILDKTGL